MEDGGLALDLGLGEDLSPGDLAVAAMLQGASEEEAVRLAK